MKPLTKKQVRDIVQDEIKSFVKKEIDYEISRVIKDSNGKSRKELLDLIRSGISKLAEFLWIQRNVWKTNIK
jgi:hypothetical protein